MKQLNHFKEALHTYERRGRKFLQREPKLTLVLNLQIHDKKWTEICTLNSEGSWAFNAV